MEKLTTKLIILSILLSGCSVDTFGLRTEAGAGAAGPDAGAAGAGTAGAAGEVDAAGAAGASSAGSAGSAAGGLAGTAGTAGAAGSPLEAGTAGNAGVAGGLPEAGSDAAVPVVPPNCHKENVFNYYCEPGETTYRSIYNNTPGCEASPACRWIPTNSTYCCAGFP